MRIAGFLVGGFFAAMAIAVGFVFFGDNSESLETPQISDTLAPVDTANISPNLDADTLEIVESVELNTNEYWIDEDGKKHYTINARDSPEIKD